MTDRWIAPFLTEDHRACDEQLAASEDHVQAKRWDEADRAFARWTRSLRHHLAREEELLFPAFEQATGQTGGPTMMMRMEHTQMRELLEGLAQALAARDGRRYLGLSESLMVLTQQHNMKEEQILYPMCDQVVDDRSAMVERLAALPPAAG